MVPEPERPSPAEGAQMSPGDSHEIPTMFSVRPLAEEIPIGPVVKIFPTLEPGETVELRLATHGHGLLTAAGHSYVVSTPSVELTARNVLGLSEPLTMRVSRVEGDSVLLESSAELGPADSQ